jgi:transcription initiation factor TFIIB
VLIFSIRQHNITCSACKSKDVITDHESGEVICSSCVLVISDNIQEGRAERSPCITTDAIYESTNTGLTNSLARHDMGLSTIIGRPNKDASGHILDATMRSRMERLRTLEQRLVPLLIIETSEMLSINFTHQKTNLGYRMQ